MAFDESRDRRPQKSTTRSSLRLCDGFQSQCGHLHQAIALLLTSGLGGLGNMKDANGMIQDPIIGSGMQGPPEEPVNVFALRRQVNNLDTIVNGHSQTLSTLNTTYASKTEFDTLRTNLVGEIVRQVLNQITVGQPNGADSASLYDPPNMMVIG